MPPNGTLLWSQAAQTPVGDLFRVQDELTRRIVASLSLPLTNREQQMLRRDVPSNPAAYEYFLRGNQLSHDAKQWSVARDLYLQSVEEDPRLRARVGASRPDPSRDGQVPAERERRKVSIRPRRRSGGRSSSIPICRSPTSCSRSSRWISVAPTTRWSASSSARTPPIRSCWPAWSARAGIAACSTRRWPRTRARVELEPKIRTSVGHTWFLQADYARVATVKVADYPYIVAISLAELGRSQEALPVLVELEQKIPGRLRDFVVAARTLLEGHAAESIAAVGRIVGSDFRDPEGLFYLSRHLAHLNEVDPALDASRTRRRRRLLLLSGDGPRSVARLAAQEAGLHQAAAAGREPGIRRRWRPSSGLAAVRCSATAQVAGSSSRRP